MVDNGAALTTLAVSCTVGQYEEVNAYATLELIGCLIAGQLWFTHLDHRCVRTCVRACVRAYVRTYIRTHVRTYMFVRTCS